MHICMLAVHMHLAQGVGAPCAHIQDFHETGSICNCAQHDSRDVGEKVIVLNAAMVVVVSALCMFVTVCACASRGQAGTQVTPSEYFCRSN
jgi:hypothetical protein